MRLLMRVLGPLPRLLWRLVRFLLLTPLLALWRASGGVAAPACRALAGVAMVVAAVALAHDLGPATLGQFDRMQATSVITHWQALAPSSHKMVRAMITGLAGGWLWSLLTLPLTLPTSVGFAALGVLLGFLGRRQRQVDIFAN